MLTAYRLGPRGPVPIEIAPGAPVPADAGWVDLFCPSRDEEQAAEAFLGAAVPTLEEVQEIEFSSRFFEDDGALAMTATLLTGVEENAARLSPMTFVLHAGRVVTLRYQETRSFRLFLARAPKSETPCDAPGIALGLLEAIVDRLADVIERIGRDIDGLNAEIFAKSGGGARTARQLEKLVAAVGVQGDGLGKARESLASLQRLLQFASAAAGSFGAKGRVKLLDRDLRSLSDHVGFLASKVTFLLDATLGLINVQQNDVIRVLTVVSMVFFPPTLIATMWGMNFRFMPELDWSLGYPLALVVIAASAVGPWLWFRWRGWL